MKVKVTQSCPTLCNPTDYTLHGILQARIPEWVAFPFSRGSSQPRDQTQVSHIVGGFFTNEPQGKPKNTEVGSLSLLQRIFPTQESNQGFLHCQQILYQPSYQRSLAPMQGFWVQSNAGIWLQSLVRELRSHMPHSMAKKFFLTN